jgi:PKD repeat protein
MKKIVLFLFYTSFIIILGVDGNAQQKRSVLFLGNSYTAVNNLPQLIHDVSLSAGDTLIFDSNTPGGYRLANHFNDLTSKAKITAGGWDYVVLQGQSQEPITNTSNFVGSGIDLYHFIKQYNSCATPITYMTWGRKNGDASNCALYPEMCTYQGMDSALKSKYLYLTNNLNGEVSPVSVVWNYIRKNYPSIELYDADESHPSAAGSYAAACCFYVSIFKKDPTLITFDFGLSSTTASTIRNAVKLQVFNTLNLWNFKKLPASNFKYYMGKGNNEVYFTPTTSYIQQSYLWDFGDGTNSTLAYPSHTYATNGNYTVTLTTSKCDLQGMYTSINDTTLQFCNHTPSIYTKNNWVCEYDTLWTQPADSYQWLYYGDLIPETKQYLANYNKYGQFGLAVISTINGCSELSQQFTESAEWSGYYFDGIGNPCLGDTVAFAVLHINGFLSGNENILWYRNDTLLTAMINEDTLLITRNGKYECKVSNPITNCPYDTTSIKFEYNCNTVGITIKKQETYLTIYPNPSQEIIFLKFASPPKNEHIDIYNAIGQLEMSSLAQSLEMNINISHLANGVYYIRLNGHPGSCVKFIKF